MTGCGPPGPFGAEFCLNDARIGWIDRSIFFPLSDSEMLIALIRDKLKIHLRRSYRSNSKKLKKTFKIKSIPVLYEGYCYEFGLLGLS